LLGFAPARREPQAEPNRLLNDFAPRPIPAAPIFVGFFGRRA
jgi:hypothetical protein